MNTLQIASRRISFDDPVLVIAEIGVNHDGSVDRALELVRSAAENGADAVKLQIFNAQTLVHGSSQLAAYQKEHCPKDDPVSLLRKYELSRQDLQRVIDNICSYGLLPLATPFSLPDVRTCQELNLPAIKIASPDLVNLPLLKKAAMSGKPLLLSTGAATMGEVQTTAEWMRDWGARFALLHCVSSYPTPAEQANLCWIDELTRRFNVPVGFSDHTQNMMTGALAVAAGASLIEKHITYDCSAAGPDHSASANPQQFAQYIQWIRQAEQMRGKQGKHVLEVERDVRTVSRQSLVVAGDLPAGHVVCEDDLMVQRPGTGIPAGHMPAALGKKTMRGLCAGTLLQWDMLGNS